ncbi:MAG TPA: glycosyltransferase [Gemmatimonadaceae bacterium]
MRLAIFTNRFPAPVSTFFARDVRALLEAGVDVDVFALYPLSPELWRLVPAILNERVLPRSRVHHASVGQTLRSAKPWPPRALGDLVRDVVRVGVPAARRGADPLSKSLYAIIQGRRWSEQCPGPYDHVLAYWGNYAATCAYAFHRRTSPRAPFSIMLHAGTDLYRTPADLPRKLRYADNIFVVCEFNRRFLRERFPALFARIAGKVHVHHLGLDLAEFRYEPNDRPPCTVLGVGTLEEPKGFDVLLRAAAALHEQGTAVRVELVGDGPAARSLRALARELRIDARVVFRGWLPPDEVRIAMRHATLLAHPSIALGDAVPTVIKEAMAIGTPVVASDLAGIPELLDSGRCGVLVPPRDVLALARAIAMLLAHDAERACFAAAARAHMERTFDLWRNGRRLAELLASTTHHAEAASVA